MSEQDAGDTIIVLFKLMFSLFYISVFGGTVDAMVEYQKVKYLSEN